MLKMLKYEMKIKDEFKDGVVSYLSNKNDWMKKLYLLLSVLLLIVGCSEDPINYETKLVERDGVFYTKDTNKPYSGRVFSLYDDGKKKIKVENDDNKIPKPSFISSNYQVIKKLFQFLERL